jgi:hypothetical protein
MDPDIGVRADAGTTALFRVAILEKKVPKNPQNAAKSCKAPQKPPA